MRLLLNVSVPRALETDVHSTIYNPKPARLSIYDLAYTTYITSNMAQRSLSIIHIHVVRYTQNHPMIYDELLNVALDFVWDR